MKIDDSRERAALKWFIERLDRASAAMTQAGQATMKLGCSLMLLGLIGLFLVVLIF